MPLPRPMATPLRTDAAGAPSFGADAPPNFRFRLSGFARAGARRRAAPKPRPCACSLTLSGHWAARLTNEQFGQEVYPMRARRRRASRRLSSQGRGPGGPGMCLLLGAAGVGKTLLVKRLQNILPHRVGGPGPGQGGGLTGVPRNGKPVFCRTQLLDRPNS